MSNASLKKNNLDLPADRRENDDTLTGNDPTAWAKLTGSGYDKKWTSKPSGAPAGSGSIQKWKGNGSW